MDKIHKILKSLLLLVWVALSFPAQSSELVIYLHPDALGSPAAASDANGNLLWRETYRPYGERVQDVDSGANVQWYSGKVFDEKTQLSYFGARYYDPVVGRFMGIDPQAFKEDNIHSFNRYAYANNNPYKFVDPDGELPIFAIGFAAFDFYQNFQETGSITDATLAAAAGIINPFKKAKTLSRLGSKGDAAKALPVPKGILSKPLVENARLRNTVDALFQDSDKIAGGTAGAVRHELRTGTLVGGSSHIKKAKERAANLRNLLRNEKISQSDRTTARKLLDDLTNALSTKREFR